MALGELFPLIYILVYSAKVAFFFLNNPPSFDASLLPFTKLSVSMLVVVDEEKVEEKLFETGSLVLSVDLYSYGGKLLLTLVKFVVLNDFCVLN